MNYKSGWLPHKPALSTSAHARKLQRGGCVARLIYVCIVVKPHFLPQQLCPNMPTSSSSSNPSIPSKEELKGEVVTATKSTLSGLRSLAAGGVGGVCAVVVGHPFDLVKVRLQTAEKGVYNGAIDVVKRTIAREGLARVNMIEYWGRSGLPGLIVNRGFMQVSLRHWSA